MSLEQRDRALLTDLYELTMAAAYLKSGLTGRAAFELSFRSLPPRRSFCVCAGLEQAVSYLKNLNFKPDQIDYLRSLEVFKNVPDEYWQYLRDFEFTGQVDALPEGTLVFAEEPILQVKAPTIEAQIVETFLLSIITYHTLVATKAARLVRAATRDGRERRVVDFGTRRAHGPDAGVLAARASYIGGCAATSNVEAGHKFGIPITGTEAHSFVMAYDTEEEAFKRYYECFPEASIILIDTYDVIEGAKKAIEHTPGMRGVRIDSGDITTLSKKVRKMLKKAGLEGVKVLASGDLNEYRINELISAGAEVDGFGVGTDLVTSRDAPALGGIYKLVAVEKDGRWEPKAKLSPQKATYPGCKQIQRFLDRRTGLFSHDVVAAEEETPPQDSEPLLGTVMKDGKLTAELPSLEEARKLAKSQLERLPDKYQLLSPEESYPVKFSDKLREKQDRFAAELKGEKQ